MRTVLPNHAVRITMLIGLWVASPCWSAAYPEATARGMAGASRDGGAAVEHGGKAIFEKTLPVTGELSNRDRDLLIGAHQQRRYEQRDLLLLAADATPQPSAPAQGNSPEAKAPAKNGSPKAALGTGSGAPHESAPVGSLGQPKVADAKSQSILQMIEGHESEVKRGLIIAAAAFILGWLCGGGFYARRERKLRHKLRF